MSKKAASKRRTIAGKPSKRAGARVSAKKSPRAGASKKAPSKKAASKGRGARAGASRGTAQGVASPSRQVANQAIAFLRFAAASSDAQLGAVPDAHALAQLHGADNHVAWTLGHQALSRAWFALSISGTMPPIPESYHSLFGMKSKPSADPGMYPALDELRASYRASLDALLAAAEGLTDADLGKPAHGDSGGWLTTRLDAVLKAAWHEGWHGGQIATLRRGLGLPALM